MDDGESACSDKSGGNEEGFGCEEEVGGREGGSRRAAPELAEISGRGQGLWMRDWVVSGWRTRGWG